MNWTACKVVVLDRPTLPPRSRLYSLRPLGIGTPEVESLTGYIARLAKAHYVSAGTLLGKELVGRLDKIPKIRGIPGIPTYLRSINGITPFAASMVRAVESSTHRSDLRIDDACLGKRATVQGAAPFASGVVPRLSQRTRDS